MGLSRVMLKSLDKIRYVTPSPIQAAFIPEALDGFDIIGQAKTGTGKTAAFLLPILHRLEMLASPAGMATQAFSF